MILLLLFLQKQSLEVGTAVINTHTPQTSSDKSGHPKRGERECCLLVRVLNSVTYTPFVVIFCCHRKFPVLSPLVWVSARSLVGSPRCDFTLIRKVALPARTRCVSRQTISRKISASGAVAGVAFPPCPTHFLVAHKTASLSHNRRTPSLRAADCNANTTPPQLRPV